MNSYIKILISLISVLVGFITAYILVKRKPNKSYEPDYIKAQMELQNMNYTIAVSYFEEVLNNIDNDNPFFISSLVGLSESYIGKNDKVQAKKYIEKAIEEAQKGSNNLLKNQLQKILNKIDSNG